MNTLRHVKGLMAIIFYVVSCVLMLFGYLYSVYEYQGKGSNVPNIVSMDSVIVTLVFTALSAIFASIAFWFKRKYRAALYVFIVLLVLNLFKIYQIILVLYKVGKGILQSM